MHLEGHDLLPSFSCGSSFVGGESRSCGCLVNIVWGVLHGGVMTKIFLGSWEPNYERPG